MSEMVFNNGSVPVAVAAKVYKKDPCWVRAGLIAGWLPIGFATRDTLCLKLCGGDVEEAKVHTQIYMNAFMCPSKKKKEGDD